MTTPRAEIGREIPKNLQYLKEREEAFKELLGIFKNITDGKEFVLRLPDAAKKYSQFLSVSDREPLVQAVADWIKNFLNPEEKYKAWAKILSVVMSSGANRCDVNSPGINEVARLIPFSPFKLDTIVAHVTAFAIISPNKVLQPNAHHEDYQKVRRAVYEEIVSIHLSDICMGAEYFVAGKIWGIGVPDMGLDRKLYVYEVVPPIDRRG